MNLDGVDSRSKLRCFGLNIFIYKYQNDFQLLLILLVVNNPLKEKSSSVSIDTT